MNAIASRLKIIMGELSARKFAERLGMSPTTVQEYLKGRTPPADFIERVCVCFGIDSWWLLTGAGEMRRQPATATSEPAVQYIQSGSGDPQIREMISIMGGLDKPAKNELLKLAKEKLELRVLREKGKFAEALEPRTIEQIKKLESITPEAAVEQKKRSTAAVKKRKKVLQ